MQTDEQLAANRDLIRRYAKDILTGQHYDRLDAFLAPNFVDHRGSQPIRGALELQKQMIKMHEAFPDLDFQIVEVVAQDDMVAVHFNTPGTHCGSFAGLAPTNRPVLWRGMMLYRVDAGKIVQAWGYWNDAEIITTLKDGTR
jgi:steroid delta-isomerase-like uncharacterized protein